MAAVEIRSPEATRNSTKLKVQNASGRLGAPASLPAIDLERTTCRQGCRRSQASQRGNVSAIGVCSDFGFRIWIVASGSLLQQALVNRPNVAQQNLLSDNPWFII